MREGTTLSASSDSRGQSELVGIVLLFGMVIGVAGLVFVTGSSVIDSTQDEIEVGQLELTSEVVDEQLQLAAENQRTGQSLPQAEVGQYNTTDQDGTVQVAWFNDTKGPTWDSTNDWTSDTATLGAVKLEHDEITLVHQGGAVWKQTENGATMETPPPIAYDGERLQLELMQVRGQGVDTANPTVSHDRQQTEALADTLRVDPDDYPPHYAIKIETQYVDAWEHALRETLDAESYNTVTIERDPNDNYVIAKVEDLYNLDGAGEIVVDEDLGPDEEKLAVNNGGQLSTNVNIDVELFNTGIDEATEDDIELVLHDPAGNQHSRDVPNDVPLDGRENTTKQLTFPSGHLPNNPELGVWEYDVFIDGESQLDTRGELYLGEKDDHLVIDTLDVEVDGDTATVDAVVENIGVDSVDDAQIEYELDGEAELAGQKTVDLEWGSETTLEWEIEDLPEGDGYTFSIETDEDDQTESFNIDDGALPQGIYIERDRGVGDEQRVVADSQSTFEVELWNTADSSEETPLTVTVYDGDEQVESATDVVSVEPADESDDKPVKTVDLSTSELTVGEVYEYNITTADDGLDERGSFYVGEDGTSFEFSNATAAVADAAADPDEDTVDIAVGIENVGVEAGEATLEFDLEYEDGETPDEYEIDPVVTDEFAPGQSGEIEWRLNRSRLFAGNHSVTVNDEVTAAFEVSTDLDPGRTGISGIRNANVTTEILGTQTSDSTTSEPHVTAPIEFQIRGQTESGGEYDLHTFRNHEGGTNLNTGPSWQSNNEIDEYEQTVPIDRDEDVTLSLRADAHYDVCSTPTRPPCTVTPHQEIPNFDEDSIGWLNNPVDPESPSETVDPVGDEELRRVRVRSAEENTVPDLPAGTDQQISATELLDQRNFVENRGDGFAELDLDDDEFIFLFQLTRPQDWNDIDPGIDGMWDAAIEAAENNPGETYDPNFNDAVVYVQIEHAPVEISNPLLEIDPVKADPIETGSGEGGDIEVSDPTIDGSSSTGDSPDLDTGESDYFDPVEAGPDVELDVDVISLR